MRFPFFRKKSDNNDERKRILTMLKDNEIGTFESWPYHVPTFAEEKSKFEALTKAFQEAKSGPEALAAYQKMTELSDHLQDDVTHIQVLFSLETQNPTYQKDMDSLNQELPLFTVEQQKFMKAMLSLVMTLRPNLLSNCLRAALATLPPSFATCV